MKIWLEEWLDTAICFTYMYLVLEYQGFRGIFGDGIPPLKIIQKTIFAYSTFQSYISPLLKWYGEFVLQQTTFFTWTRKVKAIVKGLHPNVFSQRALQHYCLCVGLRWNGIVQWALNC